jgi:hypothetical protein
MSRTKTSLLPPAAYGMTNVTALVGNSRASALSEETNDATQRKAAAEIARRTERKAMIISRETGH